MKHKIILVQVFLTILLSIACCFALFGCKKSVQAPEVKDVSIVAVDGKSQGKAGALHKVIYTVPEGCKVATSVRLDGVAATVADYSYINDEYVFYTAGEYTVTVFASKGGMLGSAEGKITVHASEASVSNVKLSAASGESLGKAGALHVLTYTADSDCEITVEIKKDGVPATDIEFNEEYNTIVFGSTGKYTVTVTATLGTASDSAEAEIEIGAADAPSVSLSLDKSTVQEDGEVTLSHTATYASGDVRKEESVTMLYRKGASGDFTAANADTYTLNGDKFTPHVAGEWKIVYKALGFGGAAGEGSATLKCTPAELTLSPKTQERQRIRTENPTEIDYLVTGAADKYDVTYDTHGKSGIETEKGDGNSVRITAANIDYFTVTVTYTHKVDTSVKKTVDLDVYSVESLLYAPTWGADPFDGIPSEVLTSMGHMLYFNASACTLHNRALTYAEVKYEVEKPNLTANASVNVMYASDDINYPYVLVSNFGNNSATGSFTVKMTLTDSTTGFAAVAYKDFTVKPTNNNASVIRDYVKNNAFYNVGQMNFDNAAQFSQENMVLTKTGTIMHRRNETDFSTGDFAHADFVSAAANCRLEFKFTVVGANPQSGEAWLGIGLRTVTSNGGWAGFLDLHLVGGRLGVSNGLSTAVRAEYSFDADRPLAASGTTLYVRIDRRVNGSIAEYTVYGKTEESASFEPYYRCTYATSTNAENAGAPVKQYQFTHRNVGGCYAVENVVVTNYDA